MAAVLRKVPAFPISKFRERDNDEFAAVKFDADIILAANFKVVLWEAGGEFRPCVGRERACGRRRV